jgi:hypothetical protein
MGSHSHTKSPKLAQPVWVSQKQQHKVAKHNN